MPPTLTPLFHPESYKEADKAIQEAEDMMVQLTRLSEGLHEFNWKVDEVKASKAEWQWEQQRLADEQAEKDQHMAAKDTAEKEWQEKLAELAWVNWEVSSGIFFQISAFDLAISCQAHARAQVELEAGTSRPKNKVSTMLTRISLVLNI